MVVKVVMVVVTVEEAKVEGWAAGEKEEAKEEDAENDRDTAGEGSRGEVDELRDSLGEFRV